MRSAGFGRNRPIFCEIGLSQMDSTPETGWFDLPILSTCLAKASLEDRPIFCEIGVDFALSTPETGWFQLKPADLKD